MEDLNINVLKGFNVRARNIRKEKSVYVCATEKGLVSIQKTTASRRSLIFQNEVKNHLKENGFSDIDCFYMSVQEQPFFEFNNDIYTMINYIDGKNADFASNDDFKKTISALALMHKITKKVSIPEEFKLYRKDNLSVKFSKKSAELAHLRKRVKRQSHLSDFDVIFLKNYDYYLNNLKIAIDLLEKSKFSTMCEDTKNNVVVCHNTLKEEYIYLKDNRVIITNFNQSLIDSAIIDLADIIKRYIKYFNEKHLSLNEILDIYLEKNLLSKVELEAILPLLIYPSKFIKICGQYYSKNRSWVPGSINARITSLINKKDVTENFIKSCYKF